MLAKLQRLLREAVEALGGLIDAAVENPWDPDRYGVLADALEEDGDCLGELLRIAIRLHDDTLTPEQQQALEQQWIQTFGRCRTTLPRKDVIIGDRYVFWGGNGRDNGVTIGTHGLTNSLTGEAIYARNLPHLIQRALILSLAEHLHDVGFGADAFRYAQHSHGPNWQTLPWQGRAAGPMNERMWNWYVGEMLADLYDWLVSNGNQGTFNIYAPGLAYAAQLQRQDQRWKVARTLADNLLRDLERLADRHPEQIPAHDYVQIDRWRDQFQQVIDRYDVEQALPDFVQRLDHVLDRLSERPV